LRRRGGKADAVSPAAVDVNVESVVPPVVSIIPPVISKVLMAEVENVTHDPFKVTEEIKVCIFSLILRHFTIILFFCCSLWAYTVLLSFHKYYQAIILVMFI
jgi:hypothetical protein